MEPEKAAAWLNLLRESEKAFEDWNERLRQHREAVRQPELLRSTGARPPVQVVLGQPRDPEAVDLRQAAGAGRRPQVQGPPTAVPDRQRAAGALLGRGVRPHAHRRPADAGARRSRHYRARRGVVPLREPADEERQKPEYVCVDHKSRRDFLHSLSRNWREVTWVAAASYLTRAQAKARFGKYSGDEYQKAEYKVDQRPQGDRRRRQPRARQVLGDLAQGHEQGGVGRRGLRGHPRRGRAAPGELSNFFPCPKPAYSAVQPGSLIPVPDVLQYKDQLDEVNTLTDALHALSQYLEVEGLLPGRQRRDQRRGADGGQDEHRRAACWCRSATGRRSAGRRRSSSGCRST